MEAKYFHTHLLGLAQFGVLGVDMFFVISGVVIAAVTAGRFGDPRYAGRFLLHRLLRIYPVYWFYSLCLLLLVLLDPQAVRAYAEHAVDFVGSFTLYPSGRPFLLLQGWTLSFELCFYLVTTLALLLPQRLMPFLLAVWGAFVVIAPACGWYARTELAFLFGNPLILEFLAGFLLFHLLRRSRLHPGAGVALIVASLLWLVAVILWTAYRFHFDQLAIENDFGRRVLAYGIFAVLFLAGAMELERTETVRFARPFERVGDWSYSIYLSHLMVLELAGRLLAPRLHDRPAGIIAVAGLGIPLILLVGWLSYRWLEQPLIRLMHRRPIA